MQELADADARVRNRPKAAAVIGRILAEYGDPELMLARMGGMVDRCRTYRNLFSHCLLRGRTIAGCISSIWSSTRSSPACSATNTDLPAKRHLRSLTYLNAMGGKSR